MSGNFPPARGNRYFFPPNVQQGGGEREEEAKERALPLSKSFVLERNIVEIGVFINRDDDT